MSLPQGALEAMLDQVKVALTYVDRDGVILYRNQAAADRPTPGPREVGRNIATCHTEPDSLANIHRIFGEFREGRREPHFYVGARLGGRELVTLVPLFEANAFVGCLSVIHTLEPPEVSKSF